MQIYILFPHSGLLLYAHSRCGPLNFAGNKYKEQVAKAFKITMVQITEIELPERFLLFKQFLDDQTHFSTWHKFNP